MRERERKIDIKIKKTQIDKRMDREINRKID